MLVFKLISLLFILMITIIAAYYPFAKKIKTNQGHDFPMAEALASGVFLGAGLIHMLGDSAQGFLAQGVAYPWPFLLAGVTFLVLLFLEHIGREMHEHEAGVTAKFAVLATVMLSIHSFLAGAALGISDSLPIFIMVLLAILAHKWAASFSLAVQINKSDLSTKAGLLLFSVFALMVPLGIVCGSAVMQNLKHAPLLEPIFTALAAGTFLYLGTLHGLNRAVLVKQCCDLKRFYFVILGFAVMAIVAIWT